MLPYINLQTFYLGPIPIRLWGLFVALGILAATWLAIEKAKQQHIKPDHLLSIALYSTIAGIITGIIFDRAFYNPGLNIFNLGEISFIGAFIGGIIVIIVYCRIENLRFWQIADTIAPALVLGQFIGHIGSI